MSNPVGLNHIFIFDSCSYCLACRKSIASCPNSGDGTISRHLLSKKHNSNVAALFELCVPDLRCRSREVKYVDIVNNVEFKVSNISNETSYVCEGSQYLVCLLCEELIFKLDSLKEEVKHNLYQHLQSDLHLSNIRDKISWTYHPNADSTYIAFHKMTMYCSLCDKYLDSPVNDLLKNAVDHLQFEHQNIKHVVREKEQDRALQYCTNTEYCLENHADFQDDQTLDSIQGSRLVLKSLNFVENAGRTLADNSLETSLTRDSYQQSLSVEKGPNYNRKTCNKFLEAIENVQKKSCHEPDSTNSVSDKSEKNFEKCSSNDYNLPVQISLQKSTGSNLFHVDGYDRNYQENRNYCCNICQQPIEVFNKDIEYSMDRHFEDFHSNQEQSISGNTVEEKERCVSLLNEALSRLPSCFKEQHNFIGMEGSNFFCKLCSCKISCVGNEPIANHLTEFYHETQYKLFLQGDSELDDGEEIGSDFDAWDEQVDVSDSNIADKQEVVPDSDVADKQEVVSDSDIADEEKVESDSDIDDKKEVVSDSDIADKQEVVSDSDIADNQIIMTSSVNSEDQKSEASSFLLEEESKHQSVIENKQDLIYNNIEMLALLEECERERHITQISSFINRLPENSPASTSSMYINKSVEPGSGNIPYHSFCLHSKLWEAKELFFKRLLKHFAIKKMEIRLNTAFFIEKDDKFFCKLCEEHVQYSESGSYLKKHCFSSTHNRILERNTVKFLEKLENKSALTSSKKNVLKSQSILDCIKKSVPFNTITSHLNFIITAEDSFVCLLCSLPIAFCKTGAKVKSHLVSKLHKEKFYELNFNSPYIANKVPELKVIQLSDSKVTTVTSQLPSDTTLTNTHIEETESMKQNTRFSRTSFDVHFKLWVLSKENSQIKENSEIIGEKEGNFHCQVCDEVVPFSNSGSKLINHLSAKHSTTSLDILNESVLQKELSANYLSTKRLKHLIANSPNMRKNANHILCVKQGFYCTVCWRFVVTCQPETPCKTMKNRLEEHFNSADHISSVTGDVSEEFAIQTANRKKKVLEKLHV